jgi:hypothetical protein
MSNVRRHKKRSCRMHSRASHCGKSGVRQRSPLSFVGLVHSHCWSKFHSLLEIWNGYAMIAATNRTGIASTRRGKYHRLGSRRSFGFAYGAIKPATSSSCIENNRSAPLHVGTLNGSTVSAPAWVRTMAPATPVVAGTKYLKHWLYPGPLKGTHVVSSERRMPPNPSIEGMPKRLRLLGTPHVKR